MQLKIPNFKIGPVVKLKYIVFNKNNTMHMICTEIKKEITYIHATING